MIALQQMAIKRSFNVENRHSQPLRKDKNIIKTPKMKEKRLKVNLQKSTSAITLCLLPDAFPQYPHSRPLSLYIHCKKIFSEFVKQRFFHEFQSFYFKCMQGFDTYCRYFLKRLYNNCYAIIFDPYYVLYNLPKDNTLKNTKKSK